MKNSLDRFFQDFIPNFIKTSSILVAIPRLVVALLRSEGFELPETWLFWWIPLSALFGVALAVIEGLSFAYILNQWKYQKDKDKANKLFTLAVISLLTFCFMVMPSIAASVMNVKLSEIISNSLMLWIWSFLVVFAPTIIIASVGYAQKSDGDKKSNYKKQPPKVSTRRRGRPRKNSIGVEES